MSENIFAEDWHECLEAHYMHVVRTHDKVTLPSLTVVMRRAGFDESQLAELRVRATMHMDAVSPDFVPDLDALKAKSGETQDEKPPAPAESSIFPAAIPPEAKAEETPVLESEVELSEDLLDESELDEDEPEPDDEYQIEAVVEEPPEDAEEPPQQLTLF